MADDHEGEVELAAKAVAQLFDFAVWTEQTHVGGDGPPQHDPCTILYLLAPQHFTAAPVDLQVETQSPLTMGHTAVEFRLADPAAAACRWVTDVDHEPVFAVMLEILAR